MRITDEMVERALAILGQQTWRAALISVMRAALEIVLDEVPETGRAFAADMKDLQSRLVAVELTLVRLRAYIDKDPDHILAAEIRAILNSNDGGHP